MTHKVIWREEAIADLKAIYVSTADQANPDIALRFVQRIESAGEKLADYPDRGRRRDNIRPGMRSVPFRRAVTIFYAVDADEVQIVRVIHARRDAPAAFQDNREELP